MSQRVVNSIKEHVKKQNNNWKWIMGRTVLTKGEFLQKLDKDKKFRKIVVTMVEDLSVEILVGRKPTHG